MIRDDAVHRDLGLSDKQRDEVLRRLREVDGTWFRSRNLPAEKQHLQILELTALLQASLDEILSIEQQQRLQQLIRQALGTRMVLREDVIGKLELSPPTVDALRAAFVETDENAEELQSRLRSGEIDSQTANQEMNRLKAAERESLIKLLSDRQKAKIGELTGEAFNFAQVQRTHPLAPEFTPQGASWIQGEPLTLEQLRGKVVAVHFYAFQCINCQRNLPHYSAWHKDYGGKGLVVIGIQTPETSAERQLERVKAAAKLEGIEYPVLMDAEASNWKAWSNTMWPTVYLIDKQGFLRRWWQGELNWDGTPGEQQLRETIEQLLAEGS